MGDGDRSWSGHFAGSFSLIQNKNPSLFPFRKWSEVVLKFAVV